MLFSCNRSVYETDRQNVIFEIILSASCGQLFEYREAHDHSIYL